MNAIFLTEREAREFIANKFGKDATLKSSSVDDSTIFDVNEIPFDWSGEVQAFNVNDGEAFVAYWESADAEFTVSFKGVTAKFDSLYRARCCAEEMKDVAEDCNPQDVITISDEDGVLEEIEVELFDNEEDEADEAAFANAWFRKSVGKKIATARKNASMSIRELASASGLAKNNIERIESGAYNYTIDTLNRVLKVLNLDLIIE